MTETWALLSDIHGNIDALESVLRDVARHQVDKVVVLGDMVNYGAAPRACLERIVSEADIYILGNHEHAVLESGGRLGMTGAAGAGVSYAAEVLADSPKWQEIAAEASFPSSAQAHYGGVQLVHGSPRDPVSEYVWPGHASYFLPFNAQLDRRLAEILAARDAQHCLCGHTHIPAALVPYSGRGLFRTRGWDRQYTFVGPKTMFWVPDGETILEGLSEHPAILNPGSVGQPRDGRPEAAYALYDGDTMHYRRVRYDIAAAQARIRALPIGLEASSYLADRLARGE